MFCCRKTAACIYVLFDVIHIQSAIHAVWQTRMHYWLSSSSGSSLQTETASRAKTRKTQSKNRISRLRDSSSLSLFSFYKVFLAFSLYIKNCADYSRLIKAAGDLTQQGSDDNQRHLSTNRFPQFKKPKKWFLTWSYLFVCLSWWQILTDQLWFGQSVLLKIQNRVDEMCVSVSGLWWVG